ncbi:MAG TPA: hypothetical protein VGI75_13375, partial [Pirellulales bacterium]
TQTAPYLIRSHDRISNPFSTKYVRPGALPFQFTVTVDADSLVGDLRKNGWRGAVVGPHGSGKSTFLATFIPALQAAGVCTYLIALHDGQRHLPDNCPLSIPSSARRFPPAEIAGQFHPLNRTVLLPTLFIIDGFEQLSPFQRWRVVYRTRRQGHGLLVTVHRDRSAGKLPILFRTTPDLQTLEQLVAHLLIDCHASHHIGRNDIAVAYQTASGNLREAIFKLFDIFEFRNRSGVFPRG